MEKTTRRGICGGFGGHTAVPAARHSPKASLGVGYSILSGVHVFSTM
jgi:hypothetical protein